MDQRRALQPLTLQRAVRLAIRLQQGARLADLTTPVVSGIARWRSQPSSKSVDLQMLVLDAVGTTAEEAAHGVVMVALMQPTSRGSLSFQPNDARLDLDCSLRPTVASVTEIEPVVRLRCSAGRR